MKNGNTMNLVLKDLKLSLHPATIIYFVLAAAMLFIPNYPRPVGFFYVVIAFLMMFSADLQNKDHEFTSLLPVRKAECVKARVIAICAVELALLLFTVPFAFLAHRVLKSSGIENAAGMNINLTLYAIVFIGYGISNWIMIPGGYRKNFKAVARCVIALIVFMLVTVLLENLVCRPMGGTFFLNGTSYGELLRQLPVLSGAIVLYTVMNLIVCRVSISSYEKSEI